MKSIYIFNMRGKPVLTIRQRLIYARLCPLRRPVAASRLAEMLGGLIDRQTISSHLLQMEARNLVKKVDGGWIAIEPQKENNDFVRMKDEAKNGKWHGCFASWRLPLPAEKPFKNRRNAAELYSAYWLIYGLERAEEKKEKPGKALKVNRLAALLGVTKLTARRLIMTLRDEKLLNGDKIAPNRFIIQKKEDGEKREKDDSFDALDMRVNRLSKSKEIHQVINELTANNWMLRHDIYPVIGKALKEHKANMASGDGSALVLSWLKGRLRTKESIQEPEIQRIHDLGAMQDAQSRAIAAIEREIQAEKAKPRMSDLLAEKVIPGDAVPPTVLRMMYGEKELSDAWEKVKDMPNKLTGLQFTAVMNEITGKKKVEKACTVSIPSVPESKNKTSDEDEWMSPSLAMLFDDE